MVASGLVGDRCDEIEHVGRDHDAALKATDSPRPCDQDEASEADRNQDGPVEKRHVVGCERFDARSQSKYA